MVPSELVPAWETGDRAVRPVYFFQTRFMLYFGSTSDGHTRLWVGYSIPGVSVSRANHGAYRQSQSQENSEANPASNSIWHEGPRVIDR